ncbi:MAG: cytochrome-c oxidase, cbb3-type subunit III [Rhodospirillales bacterium]
MARQDVDAITGTETTGHEWDGIKELNTPLPKWWLYVFYVTIVWAIIYSILYPAWPSLSGYTRGLLGYSSRAEFNQRMAALDAERAVWREKINNSSLEQIANDPDLLTIAIAGGRVVFANNCAPCHGTNAVGRPGGFPALGDDDWLWGGSLEAIHTTIEHGIRNTTDADARLSQMPAYGEGLLDRNQIAAVAQHVLFLGGHGADDATGAAIFADNCAACHGELGKGNHELGAPNLTDQIWLYGNDKNAIIQQITHPKQGVMPAWQGRLSETEIKQAAIYVHSLGGGE